MELSFQRNTVRITDRLDQLLWGKMKNIVRNDIYHGPLTFLPIM